jgi:hypothetical protein
VAFDVLLKLGQVIEILIALQTFRQVAPVLTPLLPRQIHLGKLSVLPQNDVSLRHESQSVGAVTMSFRRGQICKVLFTQATAKRFLAGMKHAVSDQHVFVGKDLFTHGALMAFDGFDWLCAVLCRFFDRIVIFLRSFIAFCFIQRVSEMFPRSLALKDAVFLN